MKKRFRYPFFRNLYLQIMEDYPPEKVAEICHIRQEDLIQVAIPILSILFQCS